MTVEIRNPAKLPMDLNLAEKEFVRCLAEGQPCIVGNGELPDVPIVSGDGANVVRGDVIRFFAYGGNEENPVAGPIIHLQGSWISGVLILMHASIPYVLDFINCHFDDDVDMPHAECAGLYLHGSRLVRVLRADGLTTKGNVYLRNGFSAKGAVRLLGANIGGDLDCKGGKFYNPGGIALAADGLATKGSVILSNGFSVEGEVRLVSASIGINLDCRGGKFYNSGGIALSADGLATKGSVILSNGFFAKGEVGLLHANIGGSLNCVGGKFHNPDGMALAADGLTTKGDVNLRNDFSAEGDVRLVSASIGINLDCEGGKFHNPKGCALSANDLTTKGSVILSNGFSAEGEVELLRADIGRNLFCEGGKFHNPDGKALVVEAGNISGGLFWRDTICEGDVNLVYAKVDVLVDDSAAWKSCKVALDAFTYSRFANPMDAQSRIDWLARRPDKMGFSPLPYEQAAKVLFDMGHDNDAREILLEKEHIRMRQEKASDGIFSPVPHDAAANVLFAMGRNRQARDILLEREKLLTDRGGFPSIWKRGRKIWEVLAGYGYRPWQRTFLISLLIIGIGSVLFSEGEHAGRIVPHQPAALVSMKYQYGRIPAEMPDETVARKFSGYPEFNPILFSVDIFVPLLNLHQEPFWYPAPDGGRQHWWGSAEDGEFSWWFLLEWWYWFQIMAGGALTSFFLLSIARLLRPRQSSGERD